MPDILDIYILNVGAVKLKFCAKVLNKRRVIKFD